MIINTEWLEKQKIDPDTGNPSDPYVMAIVRVGECVLDLIEKLPEDSKIDADKLVHQANTITDEHITGNMAAYVAMIAVKCSSRGEEFKKSWNASWGSPDTKGVVNPAIVTINTPD